MSCERCKVLEGENARLRKTLEPFARIGDDILHRKGESHHIVLIHSKGPMQGVTVQHFFDARSALATSAASQPQPVPSVREIAAKHGVDLFKVKGEDIDAMTGKRMGMEEPVPSGHVSGCPAEYGGQCFCQPVPSGVRWWTSDGIVWRSAYPAELARLEAEWQKGQGK